MLVLDEEIRIPEGNVRRTTESGRETAPRPPVAVEWPAQQEHIMAKPVRQLAYAFLTLPYSTQMRIANQLGLLEDEDVGLDCATLFERTFERATARQCL